ncbi:MAG: hypothetical protein ACI92E_001542, partial [Oceanicoccus sp.]
SLSQAGPTVAITFVLRKRALRESTPLPCISDKKTLHL